MKLNYEISYDDDLDSRDGSSDHVTSSSLDE